jgi:hypothetical protein
MTRVMNEYNALVKAGASPAVLAAKKAEFDLAVKARDESIAGAQAAEAAVVTAQKNVASVQDEITIQQQLLKTLQELAQAKMQAQTQPADTGGGKGGGGFPVEKEKKEPVVVGKNTNRGIGGTNFDWLKTPEGQLAVLEAKLKVLLTPLDDLKLKWTETFTKLAEDVDTFTTSPGVVAFQAWLVTNKPLIDGFLIGIAVVIGLILLGFVFIVALVTVVIALVLLGIGIIMSIILIIGTFWGLLIAAVVVAWNKLVEKVTLMVQDVLDTIDNRVAEFTAVGKKLVEGIKTGIVEAWKGLLSKFQGLIAMLPQAVKDILGIKSPSKVFAALGQSMMRGLSEGILKNASLPTDALQLSMERVMLNGGMVSPPASASTISSNTINNNNNNYNYNVNANYGRTQSEGSVAQDLRIMQMLSTV